MKTNPTMQASMFARDFTTGNQKKSGIKSPSAIQPIPEENTYIDQNIDNFTSISNVKGSSPKKPALSNTPS